MSALKSIGCLSRQAFAGLSIIILVGRDALGVAIKLLVKQHFGASRFPPRIRDRFVMNNHEDQDAISMCNCSAS